MDRVAFTPRTDFRCWKSASGMPRDCFKPVKNGYWIQLPGFEDYVYQPQHAVAWNIAFICQLGQCPIAGKQHAFVNLGQRQGVCVNKCDMAAFLPNTACKLHTGTVQPFDLQAKLNQIVPPAILQLLSEHNSGTENSNGSPKQAPSRWPPRSKSIRTDVSITKAFISKRDCPPSHPGKVPYAGPIPRLTNPRVRQSWLQTTLLAKAHGSKAVQSALIARIPLQKAP